MEESQALREYCVKIFSIEFNIVCHLLEVFCKIILQASRR